MCTIYITYESRDIEKYNAHRSVQCGNLKINKKNTKRISCR